MAPVFQTAAVCLVALCSVQSVRSGSTPAPIGAPDDVYLNVNLARRGRLTEQLPMVVKNDTLIGTVITALPTLAGDNCASVDAVKPETAKGMYLTVPQGTTANYANLVQAVLTNGLAELQSFPSTKWGAEPWTKEKEGNLGYLLWSKSTQIGCAITQCATGTNLVVCQFTPTAVDNEAPFTQAFYDAIKARTVQLSAMTAKDLEAPGSGSIAAPTFLLGGLVAMFAVLSL